MLLGDLIESACFQPLSVGAWQGDDAIAKPGEDHHKSGTDDGQKPHPEVSQEKQAMLEKHDMVCC